MKGRQITTRIMKETTPYGSHYYVIVGGQRVGLSWYGKHLSPEGLPHDTIYTIAQELDKDYGNFMGWYIDKIL